jgi:BolA protein
VSASTIQRRIEDNLTRALAPARLAVENESHMHSVKPGSETHFKVLIVSAAFDGMTRVARQRAVNDALRAELDGGVHALTMRALTPAEWERGDAEGFVSPQCLGGSKHDAKRG